MFSEFCTKILFPVTNIFYHIIEFIHRFMDMFKWRTWQIEEIKDLGNIEFFIRGCISLFIFYPLALSKFVLFNMLLFIENQLRKNIKEPFPKIHIVLTHKETLPEQIVDKFL